MESEFLLPGYEAEALEALSRKDLFKATQLFKKAYNLSVYSKYEKFSWPEPPFEFIKTHLTVEQLRQVESFLQKVFSLNALFHLRFAKLYFCLNAEQNALDQFQFAIDCAHTKNENYSRVLFFVCGVEFVNYLMLTRKFKYADFIAQLILKSIPQNRLILHKLIEIKLHMLTPSEAEILCEESLSQDVFPYTLSCAYFMVLSKSGKFEKLFQTLNAFLIKPDSIPVGAYLYHLNCLPHLDPKTILSSHKAWGSEFLCDAATPHFYQTETLKVGYLSADFYGHPVADFLLSHLKYLDPKKITTYAYYTSTEEDTVNMSLKQVFNEWRYIYNNTPDQIFKRICDDKIDILIDLVGHTKGQSFAALCKKPAPLQITYLGYPCTTGLPQMDYRIVDKYTDPPGYEEYSTEQLIRLPDCFICYAPREPAPLIIESGLRVPPHVTFGSTNALHKVNPHVIALWGKIYKQCPEAKFLVKDAYFNDPCVIQTYTDYFASSGVPREAVTFVGIRRGYQELLELYNSIDIALDPFPYNGTTTTCEALWMGVPVVALVGDRHSARVSYSILSQLKLDECIAFSQDEYVEKALYLAEHPELLLELRKTLRIRMSNSPLCDGPKFARAFEDALFKIWNKHASLSF